MNSLKHNSTADQPTQNPAGSPANGAGALHGEHDSANSNDAGFVRFLVHELRNMLGPIRNAAHIVRLRGADDSNLRTVAELMERQINGIGRLLNSLSEAERVRRGELSLDNAVIDIVSIVRDSLRSKQALLDSRGQRLCLNVPAGPIEVRGDAARLAQVIASIVENAAKYSQEGSEITVNVEAGKRGVEVRVRDVGRGMAADTLDRVFDFYATAGGPEQGLGTSLPVARRVIELHGGTVRAESEGPGHGTELTIILPPAASEAQAGAVASSHAVDAPQPVAAVRSAMPDTEPSRRILIADDNAAVRASLSALLQDLGHVVKAAVDGEEALTEAQRWLPEFVFLDVNMPKLGGVEVARRLRQHFAPSVMKLVMMSGAGLDEPTRRGAKRAGFDHCIDKLGDTGLLVELLRNDPPTAKA